MPVSRLSLFLFALLPVFAVIVATAPPTLAQDGPANDRDDDAQAPCRNNAVVILRSDRTFTNRCPGVRYVVEKTYFDRLLRGYTAGQDALPVVEEAIADRDSLIAELRQKEALLDSTNRALVELSDTMSGESIRALSAASDTLSTAILPELRAAREDLATASRDLRAAERDLFWSRLKFAALPALAGVAVGFLLGR